MKKTIDLKHKELSAKHCARLVWQELLNFYLAHGGSLDKMQDILCDLYTLERIFQECIGGFKDGGVDWVLWGDTRTDMYSHPYGYRGSEKNVVSIRYLNDDQVIELEFVEDKQPDDNGDSMRLNELGEEILAINKANGWNVTTPECWNDTYKIPAVLAIITSETSEALEAFRHDDKENFAEEMADTLIRVLDCAAGLGIDMDKAVTEKLEKNRTRGFRHGGKRV